MAMGIFALSYLTGCSSLPKKYSYEVRKDVVFDKQRSELMINVYRPDNGKGPHPVVLVIHGGGWRSRSGDMSAICKDLAAQGFVALNITYRLAPRNPYPAAVDDVRLAVNYVRAHPAEFNADPEKLYLWGYSAGAHLALMVGLPAGSGVKGIVAGAAPTDLSQYPNSPLIKKFLGKNRDQDPKLWREASPITYAVKESPPVFMYHGKDDWLVGIDQMRLMRKILEDKKVPVETMEVGFFGHITTYYFSQAAVDAGIKFLQKQN